MSAAPGRPKQAHTAVRQHDGTPVTADTLGIVHRLVEARRLGRRWQAPALDESFTMEQGYAVQAGVAAALGWFPDGPKAWKAGGKTLMTAAPLPQVLRSPAVWPATDGGEVVIEAELAFRFGATPRAGEDIAARLASMCVSIEIVDTRIEGGMAAPTAWKLADQYLHAGLVIGEEIAFEPRDWDAQLCQVLINGEQRHNTRGSHPSGHPLYPLAWLAGHALAHTGALCAGDLVTTGAWVVAKARPGDTVEVVFPGIGSARLVLEPRAQ